ncbi:FGGY-family carbohydrate kinase [Carboxydochorda subterranea]|uniref:FGGY-family carbohydrate kinase n=1 Tax=Carboxydichorda subterranea TaxID=3109565 RepID=A0ABZ1BXQ0_9FIRM|nr:FGGY-family carbohydrate kinase [Limnochorda sp. L945t]WRP17285.1 FGGY-family carbohydrate kinase [Limnochorda sp. L945t]
MAQGYLLGVDIGTYESKGVLATTDGRVVCTQVKSHNLSIPRPGWAEHDAERDWWGDFCSLTRGLLAESGVSPSSILAVGCSAIGPDMLPVDARCRPLRPAVLYGIDTRATREIADLEALFGREAIYRRCGTVLSAQSVGPKILWLKRNEPENYRRAHRFVGATSFLVARLTGRYVIDHYSCASFDPMYDAGTGRWAEDLCRPIVEPERLPEIVWTTEVAGSVTKEAAAETGLAAGTPVIAGTIDAAAEAVSVGVVAPGQMMVMYGSTLFMIEVLDRRLTHPQLWSAPYLFPSRYAMMGGMATSGALTKWFRDNFARELTEQESRTGRNAYATLAAEAKTVPPGAGGLVVLPYFSGERTPINDPQARGLVFGLTLAHSRAHVYRAMLEAVGYGIRHHLEVLEDAGAAPRTLRSVGGGTKNPLWLQIVSDICGKPQEVPAVTTGAAYGDAFLAGLGVGVFSSDEAIHTWVRDVLRVEPDLANTARYRPLYELYLDLYRRNKDVMHALSRVQVTC